MKNFPKIKIFIITTLITLFSTFAFAKACPLETIGLSKNNQTNKFNEVFALQMIVSQYPNIYPDALVTGYFGPKTEAAIKRIQSDNGLNDNGVITQDTLDLICSQYYQCPFQSMIGRGDELNPEQKLEAKMLQYLLKYLPKVNYRGSTNGIIGPLTEKSIIKFQNEYNLYPTQILDFDTKDELCEIFENINNQKLSAPVSQAKTTTTYSISPLKAICVAEPSDGQVNQTISFLSQVFGGNPPYKYYWSGYASGNNKTSSNIFTSKGQYKAILKVVDSSNKSVETECHALIGGQTYQAPSLIPNLLPSISTPKSTPSNTNVSVNITSDFSSINSTSDSINIFWTSENAETCYATSAPKHDSWYGPINSRGQKTISNININKGDAAIFTIVCNNQNKTEVKYVIIKRN